MIVKDGAAGTELLRRGVALPAPLWSGAAVRSDPDAVQAVHRAYADAGATVHTALTFRTGPAHAGPDAEPLTRRAVQLCRQVVPADHQVFGSVGPLADCYQPWQTPAEVRAPHAAHARNLRAAGVDGVVIETFAHAVEAQVAVEEAVAIGLPTWAALTAGPDADLLTPSSFAELAARVHDAGARVVLLNCTSIERCEPYLERLAALGMPWGCHPNAGPIGGRFGWGAPGGAEACSPWFERWARAGASVLGGCCGTDPSHVRVIRSVADPMGPRRPLRSRPRTS